MATTIDGFQPIEYLQTSGVNVAENKNTLGKDDFMKLLLIELQHQDPTEPMDSEKILTQTSQLASLESTDNTNKALADLAASLGSVNQFSTIGAIGKTADLGSDVISLDEDATTTAFEIYFPSDVKTGTVEITDNNGQTIKTIDVQTNPSGIYSFEWDGRDNLGNFAESGLYHVNASYTNSNGQALQTRLGAYPIESVRFDGGETLVKVGSNYVPLASIKEVY